MQQNQPNTVHIEGEERIELDLHLCAALARCIERDNGAEFPSNDADLAFAAEGIGANELKGVIAGEVRPRIDARDIDLVALGA